MVQMALHGNIRLAFEALVTGERVGPFQNTTQEQEQGKGWFAWEFVKLSFNIEVSIINAQT